MINDPKGTEEQNMKILVLNGSPKRVKAAGLNIAATE